MIEQKLPALKFNSLTKQQYQRALENNQIKDNEFYLVIEDGADIQEIKDQIAALREECVELDQVTLISANAHTDEEIAALIDGDKYPGALDTIKEISAAIEDNAETIEILNNAITTKANKDTVGELTDYWQYVENTDSVITAINQNADWVLRNFEQLINKTQDIASNKNSSILYPSAKAVADYVRGYEIVYDGDGFEASNDYAGETWHLQNLNLSRYKKIKCYISAGGSNNENYSPQHIVEVDLDNRALGSLGYFVASDAAHCPNNRNRHHIATICVNAEKTAIQFLHSISMYGTAASDSVGGRVCYRIEGYFD